VPGDRHDQREQPDAPASTADDAILRMITNLRSGNEPGASGSFNRDLKLRLTAGSDDRVQQVSLTFHQQDSGSLAGDGTSTWSVTYIQLGTTPPITVPAASTPGQAGSRPSTGRHNKDQRRQVGGHRS